MKRKPIRSAKEKKEKSSFLKTPVRQIDLLKNKTVLGLVDSFSEMSIQARNVGLCAKVFKAMLTDSDRPTILLGLAGPLIAAGLRKVIRDLLYYGLVDVVVSTGAIIYQDIFQARGHQHFKGTAESSDDRRLHELLINRIYDTYVDDEKFWATDEWIGRVADSLPRKNYSSREFLEIVGKKLTDKESILYTATRFGIPVFVPALNDSSIGIGLTEHYFRKYRKTHRQGIVIDAIRDNYEITQLVVRSKKTSGIYIAGGVPKNYINDSIVMSYIFGHNTPGHSYCFQLTTDSPHWGGLSGSTLKEATSWGKISSKATHAMAFVEPSVSLPLVASYVLQKRLYKNRPRLQLSWDEEKLTRFGRQR